MRYFVTLFALAAMFAMTSCTPEEGLMPLSTQDATNQAAQPFQKEFTVSEDEHIPLSRAEADAKERRTYKATLYQDTESGIERVAEITLDPETDTWTEGKDDREEPHFDQLLEKLTGGENTLLVRGRNTYILVTESQRKSPDPKEDNKLEPEIRYEILEVAADLESAGDVEAFDYDGYVLKAKEWRLYEAPYGRVDLDSKETGEHAVLYIR